ncbi:hypothetical protein [Marinovum sp.]|uniref:hypothetical protein n=1 Tax=Marinovum sp. TaxID=2024839 RepID=UPI002B27A725|nr:hypothetical protein [Marinovum sp.]
MPIEDSDTARRSTGIRLENCSQVSIENVRGIGIDTLISAEKSDQIRVKNIDQYGGSQVFRGQQVTDLEITDVTFVSGAEFSDLIDKILLTRDGQKLLVGLKQAAEKGASKSELQRQARGSKVGLWLESQKFTDWAGLLLRLCERL